jgi:hypothetical protein
MQIHTLQLSMKDLADALYSGLEAKSAYEQERRAAGDDDGGENDLYAEVEYELCDPLGEFADSLFCIAISYCIVLHCILHI